MSELINKVSVGTTIAGVLVLAVGFYAIYDAINKAPAKLPSIPADRPYHPWDVTDDSPIIVVGGSMTIGAKKGWTPTPSNGNQPPYTVAANTISIALQDVDADSGGVKLPVENADLLSLQNVSWTVNLLARKANGDEDIGEGLQIVSDGTSLVTVTVIPNSKTSSFRDFATSTIDSANHPHRFLRYKRDSSVCDTNQTNGTDYCEHIAKVEILIPKQTGRPSVTTYENRCPQGLCRVLINIQ